MRTHQVLTQPCSAGSCVLVGGEHGKRSFLVTGNNPFHLSFDDLPGTEWVFPEFKYTQNEAVKL